MTTTLADRLAQVANTSTLRLIFVLAYEPSDFPFVLRTLASGRIGVDGLVSATIRLDETPEMFARLQKPNDHCKVLITP